MLLRSIHPESLTVVMLSLMLLSWKFPASDIRWMGDVCPPWPQHVAFHQSRFHCTSVNDRYIYIYIGWVGWVKMKDPSNCVIFDGCL